MHKHKRARIRQNALQLLKTGVDVGGRFYASRPHPLWLKNELPIGLVYFLSETVDEEDTKPENLKRTLKLSVDIITAGEIEEDIDNFLDDRAFEVESSLFYKDGWTEDIDDIRLIDVVPYNPQSEGELIISATKLTFEIDYYTDKGEILPTNEFLSFINTINTTDNAITIDNVIIREV